MNFKRIFYCSLLLSFYLLLGCDQQTDKTKDKTNQKLFTPLSPEETNINDSQRFQSLFAYLFLATALTALMIYSEILREKLV